MRLANQDASSPRSTLPFRYSAAADRLEQRRKRANQHKQQYGILDIEALGRRYSGREEAQGEGAWSNTRDKRGRGEL